MGLGRLQFHMAKHQGVRVFVTAGIVLKLHFKLGWKVMYHLFDGVIMQK